MALQQLIDDFAPDADGITRITAAKAIGAGPLLARLGLGVGPLEFASPQTLVGATSVTLVGTVTWRGSSGRASIVGSDVQGGGYLLVFQLDIQRPSPWTLGVAFQGFPDMWRSEPDGLVQSRSYLYDVQINLPSVLADNRALEEGSPRGRLRGRLPFVGDMAPYASYVGPDPLGLDGWFSMDAQGNAHLVLEAVTDQAPAALKDYGGLVLNGIGLRLTTEMRDDLAVDPSVNMSALLLVAHVPFKGKPIEITAPLIWGDFVWPLFANLWDAKPTLSEGIDSLAQLFGLPANRFSLPPGIDILDRFYLAELGIGLVPPAPPSHLPSLQYLSATVASDYVWHPPIPYLTVENIVSNWVFYFFDGPALPELDVVVGGDLVLGGGSSGRGRKALPGPSRGGDGVPIVPADAFRFRVKVFYPDWAIEGQLLNKEGETSVPMLDLFRAFNFDGTGGPLDQGLTLVDVGFRASLLEQTLNAYGSLTTPWTLQVGNVEIGLHEVWMWVNVSQSGVTGGITGIFYLDMATAGEPGSPGFLLSADFLGNGRWKFAGEMTGQLELVKFLTGIANITPPDWVKGLSVTLTRLALNFDTGDANGSSYHAEGRVVAKWHINALGIDDLALEAAAEVSKTPAWPTPQGKLQGSFSLNKITVFAGVELTRDQQTYLFGIRFDQLELIATTAWSNEGGTAHQVLNVQLRGMTLGGVLEYLVRLAAPDSQFSLEAPWNVLNRIDLANFLLTLDRFNNTVTLSYKVDANLGFMHLDSVGVRYTYSGKGRVNLVVAGRILDREYGKNGEPPLTWDVVNDPPPALPGKGPRLLELRYLGMGQHVTLSNMSELTTVEKAITALRTEMKSADDPDANPINQPNLPSLQFSDTSQWMVGLDLTVMDTVSLAVVLHDPDLYGLLISLGGPQAGSLAGFSFELLYRKVTDDIGVFRVQLKVPDLFRQIELGAVSITLGIITVEIYTNGNFMVDLGFPHNRDYSVAFAVQVLPFIGRGGLYFARLNGATSRRVPVVTNGNFEPVLEMGIGLAVGLGKEFNKGPLSAGLYVELEVIIEGVLGWFHPLDSAQAPARYYWVQGLAGISGKLYGKVDFKIIRVSISVSFHAYAMVTLEAYQATEVELELKVEAHAKVSFLFFSISFSFSLTLHEHFTLGSRSTPPWILAPDQTHRLAAGLQHSPQRPPFRRGFLHVSQVTRAAYFELLRSRHPSLYASLSATSANPCDAYLLKWDENARIFPGIALRPVVLRVMLVPSIDQVGAAFSPASAPANLAPAYRVAVMLAVDTGDDLPPIAPEPSRPTTLLSAHASDVSLLSFNVLIEAFLRWALLALPDHTAWPDLAVAGQLEVLAEQMACPQTASTGFTWSKLKCFLGINVELRVCMPPDDDQHASELGACLFPMPPLVKWDSTAADRSRDFSTYQPVDGSYEQLLSTYFDKLDPLAIAPARDLHQADAPESAATGLFCDALLILAKTVVQQAQEMMRNWQYAYAEPGSNPESLADIAQVFAKVDVDYTKQMGDTVDQVAAHFGLSVTELAVLNQGIAQTLAETGVNAVMRVHLGVTAQSLAVANAHLPLAAGTLELGDVVTQVQAAEPGADGQVRVAETLSLLATRFGKTPAAVARGDTLSSSKLLRGGARPDVSTLVFDNADLLALNTVIRLLFVRLYGVDAVDTASYQYQAQLLAEYNRLEGVAIDTPLVAGSVLNLSGAVQDTWKVQLGDTLARVAAMLSLQLPAGQPVAYQAFATAMTAINAGRPLDTLRLPQGQATKIAEGESLSTLAQRLLLSDEQLVSLLADSDVLQTLAVVLVPAISVSVTTSDSLNTLSQRYNLNLDTLGYRLADQPGLFDGHPLVSVPNVPAVSIGTLVKCLQHSEVALHIAGMVSRFLLHGLRPPTPTATQTLAPLYEIVGQQIIPDVLTPLPLTFGHAQPALWLNYYFTAVSQVESLGQFAARVGVALEALTALNPAVAERYQNDVPMPQGLVLTTGQADAGTPAVLTVDHCKLKYPDPVVQLPTVRPLHAMPLAKWVPVTHGLQQHVTWQASVNPWAPGTQGGTPSLWMFPATLLRQAASAPAYAYQLVANSVQPGAAQPPQISHYAWGTLLDIRIRRIGQLASVAQGNSYEVLGADTAARQTLLALWQALPDSGGADIHLLYAAQAQSDRPNGLCSSVPQVNQTFIIRSNLSTETASGARTLVGDPALPIQGAHFAQLDAPKAFLTLLWECSVVGGGGYTLGFSDVAGNGFPAALFDSTGNGVVSVLVVPKPAALTLQPWYNCAVVGDNVDASAVNLVVRAVGDQELMAQPAVTPGHVGFDFALSNPDMLAEQTDAQQRARQAYSLAGYQLAASDAFTASNTAMPVGPQSNDPEHIPNGQMTLSDNATWFYHRVVPISRFARQYFAPQHPALPNALDDPYAGVAALWSADAPRPATTTLNLWFQDLLGNVSAHHGDTPVASLPALMVGYTDALKGPGQWPNMATGYRVSAAASQAWLHVSLALQLAAYVPGPGDSVPAMVNAAAKHRQAYRDIHYQLAQPDLTSVLTTNLAIMRNSDGTLVRRPLPADVYRLRSLAAATYVFLEQIVGSGEAPGMQAALAAPVDGQAFTLANVLVDYGFTTDAGDSGSGYQLLGAANAAQPLSQMLWGDAPPVPAVIDVPTFQVVRDGDSCKTLFGDAATALTVLSTVHNQVLGLRVGQTLGIPCVSHAVPAPAAATLSSVAASLHVEVQDLALSNADTHGLLRLGFTFDYEGLSAEVGLGPDQQTVSLNAIAQAFASRGYPVAAVDLAVLNQYYTGVFADAATLSVDTYQVQPGDTLISNAAALSIADLVNHNLDTTDLFDAGVPILRSLTPNVAVGAGQALSEFAQAWGMSPAQLLQSLGDRALAAQAQVWVPGAATWSGTGAFSSPYQLRTGDTLAGIALQFSADSTVVDARQLVQGNAALPGVLTAMPISIAGTTVLPTAGASFNEVVAGFRAKGVTVSLDQLADTLNDGAGHLQDGALLICPLARLAAGTSGLKLTDIQTRFGVRPADFATANAAVPGLLLSAITMRVVRNDPKGGEPGIVTTPTRRGDTFNSVAARFAAAGVPVSVGELAGFNRDLVLIEPATRCVLPPCPMILQAPLGAETDSGEWLFEQPLFDLSVNLTLSRCGVLVDTAFQPGPGQAPSAVQQATSQLAPIALLGAEQVAAVGLPMTLTQFALDLEQAIAPLRLASGKVVQEGVTSSDVWAVVFGGGGVKTLTVTPGQDIEGVKQPWYFALRPLATDLIMASDLLIKPLKNGELEDAAVPTAISGVDLETWARRFLADFDRLLDVGSCAALYRQASVAVRSRLDTLIDCKAQLAQGIAAGLDFVLTAPTSDGRRLKSARDQLRQRLLAQLSAGYDVNVVLQWDADVESTWQQATVKLVGTPQQADGSDDHLALGSSKVTLADKHSSAADPYVNVTLKVNNSANVSPRTLSARFDAAEIEFDIAAVAGVTGYASSNWLRFVHPLADNPPSGYHIDLGVAHVPIPLRAYPTLPQLVAQATVPDSPQAPVTVAAAVLWQYQVSVGHAAIVQDEVQYDIEVNLPPEHLNLRADTRRGLIASLAQYMAVADELWNVLAGLADTRQGDAPTPVLSNAINTFIDLAQQVSVAWQEYWQTPSNTATGLVGATALYQKFSLTSRLFTEDGSTLSALTLTAADGSDPGPGGWPHVEVVTDKGLTVALTGQAPQGQQRRYVPATTVPLSGNLVQTLIYPGLGAAGYQNAQTTSVVIRNVHLMPSDTPATREGFVYRTPALTFADRAVPLLEWGAPITIGSFSAQDSSALVSLFNDVLQGAGPDMQVSVAASYSRVIAEGLPGEEALMTSLPVLLLPRSTYQTNLPDQLAHTLEAWQSPHSFKGDKAYWELAVSLYSSVDAEQQRPVVILGRVLSPIITDA